MLQKLLAYCLLYFIGINACAQVQILSDGKEIDYANAQIKYALIEGGDFSNTAFFGIGQQQWKNLSTGKIPISNTPNCVWLKIPVNSLLQYGSFNFININNPHINYLQCWMAKNGRIIKQFKRSGDNLAFATRPLPTVSFVYHIDGTAYKDCDFIIAADKRYTKLNLPVNFSTEAYYINNNQKKNLFTGLLMGIMTFLLIFNFYLLVSIKQRLYLWYSLYILMIAFYLGTDMGLMFKYFYPKCPYLNDVIRPAIIALSIVPQVNFFNDLLNIPEKMPRIFRFNKWVLAIFMALFVLAISTSVSGNYQTHGFWVKANMLVYPLTLFIILAEAIYCFKKNIRYAGFMVISFTGLIIFLIIYLMEQNEVIANNDFTGIALYWALFFEGMIMAFMLAWRFKSYKEHAERLLNENQLQQENIFKETALYQQKEMQRMSALLHDTVGANLGFLRLETDNMPLTAAGRDKIAQGITQLGHEVRAMGHGFSPLTLQNKGLYPSIAETVNLIVSNSPIDLQFEWLGNKEGTPIQYEIIIYRIVQELLQNMLKHSKATSAFLQVMVEQSLVSIYAEDDGIGLEENKAVDGLGLKSLENLVTLLKGNFKIESGENKGFSISIEFNLQKNENV
jgi:signal transduction histidine kinase